MELGIGLSFGFGAGAAAGTATASAAAATATGVTAVAFAPAAAVAAVGMLAFSVWKLPDLLSQLSPQACRPDDVSSGRRAQLRVSKQHLKNRSKPKRSLPTLLATRHARRVAATSANLPKVPEADAGMAVADDSSSPLRSLDVIRSLGAGQFGQVLHVRDRSTASEYALKIIQVRPDMTQQCHMEKTAMAILSQKGAPYIQHGRSLLPVRCTSSSSFARDLCWELCQWASSNYWVGTLGRGCATCMSLESYIATLNPTICSWTWRVSSGLLILVGAAFQGSARE